MFSTPVIAYFLVDRAIGLWLYRTGECSIIHKELLDNDYMVVFLHVAHQKRKKLIGSSYYVQFTGLEGVLDFGKNEKQKRGGKENRYYSKTKIDQLIRTSHFRTTLVILYCLNGRTATLARSRTSFTWIDQRAIVDFIVARMVSRKQRSSSWKESLQLWCRKVTMSCFSATGTPHSSFRFVVLRYFVCVFVKEF